MKYVIGIGLVVVGVVLWAGKDDIRRIYTMSHM